MNKHTSTSPPDKSQLLQNCYAGKRVLVTGHTGFKGAWLSLWLLQLGADVTGLSLPASSKLGIFEATGLSHRMHSLIGDLRNPQDVEAAYAAAAPEIVFHLGAQPIVGTSYQDPLETFDVNILGTARVLDAARRNSATRAIVVITSDKCYENTETLWGHREIDPLGGHDPYSASKACAELIAASYRASFFGDKEAPKVATARAGNVIGGGDWGEFRLIPDCIHALRHGEPIKLRNPLHTRPFQFVLDALAGYLLLGAKLTDENGEDFASAWNFGPQSGARTVGAAAECITQTWGSGMVESGSADLFSEKRVLNLDSSKALWLLGWHSALDFGAAVRSTVDWYRHQYQINDGDMFAFSNAMISDFEKVVPYFQQTKA